MWQVFYLIKEAFFRDAADYFAGEIHTSKERPTIERFFSLEIMSCLHNYIINDTPAFLSQADRIETVFEMCKHVSESIGDEGLNKCQNVLQVIVNDLGEDTEAHAGKLLEIVILQCQDHMTVVSLVVAERDSRHKGDLCRLCPPSSNWLPNAFNGRSPRVNFVWCCCKCSSWFSGWIQIDSFKRWTPSQRMIRARRRVSPISSLNGWAIVNRSLVFTIDECVPWAFVHCFASTSNTIQPFRMSCHRFFRTAFISIKVWSRPINIRMITAVTKTPTMTMIQSLVVRRTTVRDIRTSIF